ncbi:MAG: DUF928 domain-containing protein [Pseudomonadales bacterium]
MKPKYRKLICLTACLALSSPAALGIETRTVVEPKATAKDLVGAEDTNRATQAASAADPQDVDGAADAQAVAATDPLTYVPPRRGAPKTRVGGGTRSGGHPLHLSLLAPEHTGLTRSASPTLYWWLSEDHPGPVEVVVMAESAVTPALRFRPPVPVAAGIHAVDLEAAGIVLEAGVSYRWSVAIVRDENARARDVVATATLEYVPDRQVAADAGALAAAGLWYDALAALDREADRAGRAALLDQVDLTEVARWVRSPAD